MAIMNHLQSKETQKILDSYPAVLSHYLKELSTSSSEIAKDFLKLPVGTKNERVLGEGLKAIEQCYMTTTRDKAIIESHRDFIDFQLIFEGEEVMETAFIDSLKIKTVYDKNRDLVVYEESSDLHLLKMKKNHFAIFKTEDAHRSTLQNTSSSLVRKVVIKIPVL